MPGVYAEVKAFSYTNAGEYIISAYLSNSNDAANYNVTVEPGTLTINKADASVTINSLEVYYTGETYTDANISFSVDGIDSSKVQIIPFSYSQVGTYTIFAVVTDQSIYTNYQVTVNYGTLTIVPQPIELE